MFGNLPTSYSVDVRTPDPIIVKIDPSPAMVAVAAAVVVVFAAWVKRRK